MAATAPASPAAPRPSPPRDLHRHPDAPLGPSGPLPTLYLLDPPERESQADHLTPGGDTPAPPPPPQRPLPPGVTLSMHAVQARLDDATANIADPPSLSVTFRHSGWTHNRLLIAQALSRTHQPQSRQLNFSNCGSDAYVLRSLDNPEVYRLAGSACHDRFCLPCAQERSHAIALNVLELTQGRQTRFLTLTLKASSDPLATQLDKLYASFQALRRRKLWKDKVTGGVAFLEITWSDKTHTWHPHFHILVEGHYIPHSKLKNLWYQITGDSFVVDIRYVRDLRTASRYVTKYASKPFNNTYLNRPTQLDECILAIKGRKLLLTFGTWRGITLIRTPSDGAWEHVAPLDTIITDAAHGDLYAQHILAKLTDADLRPLYAKAPARPPPPPVPATPLHQLDFFGSWQSGLVWTFPAIDPITSP